MALTPEERAAAQAAQERIKNEVKISLKPEIMAEIRNEIRAEFKGIGKTGSVVGDVGNIIGNMEENSMTGLMSGSLEPNEIDYIKQEKIEKQKKFQQNVDAAINATTEIRKDIQQIREEQQKECKGLECLVSDQKKIINIQDSKFRELGDRISKLEEPVYECENCGEKVVRRLSSFCPNCGSGFNVWNDDNGDPIKDWVPYPERNK